MSNQTITLKSQSVRSFGPSPSTKWGGTFNWTASGVGPGNGCWGMKSAACQASQPIIKNIFRTLTNSSMSVGISCPASSIFRSPNKTFSTPLVCTYSNTVEKLTDGTGQYQYLFPGPTTNHEAQVITVYTTAAAGSLSYTTQVVTTTTWT